MILVICLHKDWRLGGRARPNLTSWSQTVLHPAQLGQMAPCSTLHLFATWGLVNKLGERGYSTPTSPSYHSSSLSFKMLACWLFKLVWSNNRVRLLPLERFSWVERLYMTSWRSTFPKCFVWDLLMHHNWTKVFLWKQKRQISFLGRLTPTMEYFLWKVELSAPNF